VFGSGRVFNQVAHVLQAQPPRVDTAEILAELPKAQLAELAKRVDGLKPSAPAKTLATALAGKLPDWTPPEADFLPASEEAADRQNEDEIVARGDDIPLAGDMRRRDGRGGAAYPGAC
jgi:hypothetical protein